MEYEEIAPTLQTGDIVLFRGTTWISRVIDILTDSIYSHMGMVVRTSPSNGPDGLHLWQSFEPEGGVVFDHLEEFLKKYRTSERKAKFVVRHLNVQRTPQMTQTLDAFIAEVKGRPFPSMWTWFVHWVLGNLGIATGLKNFFCSQLVAHSYMRMGVLKRRPPDTSYTPGRFAQRYTKLRFLDGASLGPEIPVTLPKPSKRK